MKRIILLFAFFALLFTSCDWYADPQIIGYSTVGVDENERFVCLVDNASIYYVDSLLTFKDGARIYEQPISGDKITVFIFDGDKNVHFYKGHASSEEVKDTFFYGDNGSAGINIFLTMSALLCMYGYSSYQLGKQRRNNKKS